MKEKAKMLLEGTIDMHIHSNPHASGKKNLNSIEAAAQAQEAGMKGVVLKCNFFPTGGSAYLISHIVRDIKVFGGIVLNASVGGINPVAVEKAITYGEGNAGEFTKIIWLPTFSAQQDVVYHRRPDGEKVMVLKNGRVVTELYKIFELIAKHDLILSTGHLSEEETLPVIEEARSLGVKKIIVGHPSAIIPNISPKAQRKMADMGAFLEFCYVNTTDYYKNKYDHSVSISQMVKLINDIGVDQCVISTDLGADPGVNPSPTQGMGLFIEELLKKGLSESDIEVMAKKNPGKLLGI